MIAQLFGKILEHTSDTLILMAGPVGYEIHVTPATRVELLREPQSEKRVWIQTQVREDAITLFGFLHFSEKTFFLNLLKVNGVGPKMALNILSGASIEVISQMIESEDVKALTKLPKVGKKTAEQMILQLKGKLAESQPVVIERGQLWKSDVTSALVNLGFRIADIDFVVADIPHEIPFDEALKTCLQKLSRT